MSYIIWRLHDSDLNLWLPTQCDTFDQAADAWLEVVQSGGRAEIMERVPIALKDARNTPAPKRASKPRGKQGFHSGSRAELIAKALQDAPDGMSRKQLSEATGYAKTYVGATVAGLMKDGRVRAEKRPPDDARGMAAVGQGVVTVYFWQGD